MKTKKTISMIAIGLTLIATSGVASTQQSFQEVESRALQQARRVAFMENENDIPSRAVRLTQRVAKRSKVAYQNRGTKPLRTRTAPSQN